MRAARPDEEGSTLVRLRVLENGEPTRTWEAMGGMIEDGSGNSLPDGRPQPLEECGTGLVFWRGLWPDPSAWKVRVDLVRCDPVPVPSDVSFTLRGVPVPPANRRLDHRDSVTRAGMTLSFHGIVGRGRGLGPGEGPHTGPPRRDPRTRVMLFSVPDGHYVRVHGVDDRGQRFSARNWARWKLTSPNGTVPTSKMQSYDFALAIPLDAKRVDLTFTIRKSIPFVFYARPEAAGARPPKGNSRTRPSPEP